MYRVEMPISDYRTDLKTVLDNAIRLLQAMLDVCVANGWFATCINVIRLIQGISQAHWPAKSAREIIPRKEFHSYIFPELVEKIWRGKDTKINKLTEKLTGKELEWLKHIPILNVKISLNGKAITPAHANIPIQEPSTWNEVTFSSQTDDTSADEAMMKITLVKQNKDTFHRIHANTPMFPKDKLEGYFIILCIRGTGQVLAMKRISSIRDRSTSQNISLDVSQLEAGKMYVFTVYVLSDSYLDMDHCYDLRLKVV